MGKSASIAAFFTVTGIFLLLATGCGVFDAGLEATDATIVFDSATSEDSATFLEDVTLLHDVGGRTDTAVADQGVVLDVCTSDGELAKSDDGHDIIQNQDALSHDYGTGEDAIVSGDVPDDTTTPAQIRMPCTDVDAHTDCPDDFTCETLAKGDSYCRPPQQCSLDGLTGLPELVSALISDGGQTPVFVKLVIRIEMGPVTCSMEQCLPNDCCRTCSASLHVADSNMPIIIRGTDSQNSVGCSGRQSSDQTPCDPLVCSPLIHGETYVVWGSIRMFNPWELALDDFCPLSEAQPAVD